MPLAACARVYHPLSHVRSDANSCRAANTTCKAARTLARLLHTVVALSHETERNRDETRRSQQATDEIVSMQDDLRCRIRGHIELNSTDQGHVPGSLKLVAVVAPGMRAGGVSRKDTWWPAGELLQAPALDT